MDRTDDGPNNYILYIITLLADVNYVIGGIMMGWPQTVLPQLFSPDSPIPLTYDEGAWVAGINWAGVLTGIIIGMFVASRYGVKKTLLLGSLPAISGWIIIAIASTYWELLVARFILGVWGGMCCDFSESYIAELAPSKIRGRMCTTCNISLHLGLLLTFSIGSSLSITSTSIIYVTIYVAVLVVFAFLAPETPFWYARQGKHEKAKKCLKYLRRIDNIEREYEGIAQFVKTHSNPSYLTGENSWTKAWRSVKRIENRRAIIIVVLATSGQQLSGIQAINTYAEVVLGKTVKVVPVRYVSILLGLCELFFTTVGTMLVDNFGRKFMFTLSGFVSASLMTLMGIYFHLQSVGTHSYYLEYLPIACVLLFATSYSIGLSLVASVVACELFSSEMRIIGMAIRGLTFCVSALTVTKLWQVIASAFGDQYSFWITAVITYLHVFVLYYIQPETKGKTLAEIQVILSRPLGTRGDEDSDRRKMINYSL